MVTGGSDIWASLSARVRFTLIAALLLIVFVAIVGLVAFAHLHGLGAVMHRVVADTNIWHSH